MLFFFWGGGKGVTDTHMDGRTDRPSYTDTRTHLKRVWSHGQDQETKVACVWSRTKMYDRNDTNNENRRDDKQYQYLPNLFFKLFKSSHVVQLGE